MAVGRSAPVCSAPPPVIGPDGVPEVAATAPPPTDTAAIRESITFLTNNTDSVTILELGNELDRITTRLNTMAGISNADRAALGERIDAAHARADADETAPWNDWYSFFTGLTLGLFALIYLSIYGLIDAGGTSDAEKAMAAAERARTALQACPTDPCATDRVESAAHASARANATRPVAFAQPTLAALAPPRTAA